MKPTVVEFRIVPLLGGLEVKPLKVVDLLLALMYLISSINSMIPDMMMTPMKVKTMRLKMTQLVVNIL